MILDLYYVLPGAAFIVVLLIMLMIGRTSVPRFVDFIVATLAAFLVWYALIAAEKFLSVHFLAGGPESKALETPPWVALCYFASMVLGMLAQTIWFALQQRTAGALPTFDKWEFVKPALVAPIVFIAVYQTITDGTFKAMTLLFSFQNGFFWQTVLRNQQKQ
jgi:hypothetical protein